MKPRAEPNAKTALVTGANRGIGLEIAKGLVARGLDVYIACRDSRNGKTAAKSIGATCVLCDVSDPASYPPVVHSIDVLVNNAGVLFETSLFSPAAKFQTSLDVMVGGPYELMRLAVPHMKANGYGRIVNVSSDWGSFSEGLGGGGGYGVAKAALNALTVIADRDTPDFIKINAMCPGWVATRMGGEKAPRSPQEGAQTAIWLATLDEQGPTGGFFRDKKELGW